MTWLSKSGNALCLEWTEWVKMSIGVGA